MEKIYLYGAGGHGRVVLDILQENGVTVEEIFINIGKSTYLKGIPVTHNPVKFPLIISFGDNAARKKLATEYDCRDFGRAIAKTAIIAKTAFVNIGTVIMSGAIVQSFANIKRHVIINTGSTIDHECVINDYAHIAPGCNLCGKVEVGEGTLIGAGTVVIPDVKIGKWCVIGAGSVVTKDIPDYSVAVGSPCRVIKRVEYNPIRSVVIHAKEEMKEKVIAEENAKENVKIEPYGLSNLDRDKC